MYSAKVNFKIDLDLKQRGKVMEKFVAIIPKSPLPQEGRVGNMQSQDWYKTCLVARGSSWFNDNCPIFISSAFQSRGKNEADFYKEILQKIGGSGEIIVRYRGMETIGHLDAIFAYAKENKLEPIIVSTKLHCPRVKFISRRYGYPCEHQKAFGAPRPKEARTDIALNFLFPLIHWLGLEKLFVKTNTGRREEGKI